MSSRATSPPPRTEDVSVTSARVDDVEAIAQMFADDMGELGENPTREALHRLTERLVGGEFPQQVLRVARDADGTPIGVVLANLFVSIKFPGSALWLEEIYVVPAWRRGGIGRLLVDDLLAWAYDNDIRGVELESYRMNTGASILYRTLGFRRLARERYSFAMADYAQEEE